MSLKLASCPTAGTRQGICPGGRDPRYHLVRMPSQSPRYDQFFRSSTGVPVKASRLSISTTLSLTARILQRLIAIRLGRTGAWVAKTPRIPYLRPRRFDRFGHRLALVRGQVVHHHNVTGSERRDQHVLDVLLEHRGVDGAFQGQARLGDHALDTDCRQHGGGLPVPMRHRLRNALAPQAPGVPSCPVGLGP